MLSVAETGKQIW